MNSIEVDSVARAIVVTGRADRLIQLRHALHQAEQVAESQTHRLTLDEHLVVTRCAELRADEIIAEMRAILHHYMQPVRAIGG